MSSSLSPAVAVHSHFPSLHSVARRMHSNRCVLFYKRTVILCRSQIRQTDFYESRYAGLEKFIDESDFDESALASLVLRSAFTRSSRSVHSGYHCDIDHIGERVKAYEKVYVESGFFTNTEKRVYPFFPEDLPQSEVLKPPMYSTSINKKLLSIYVSKILPSFTTKISVEPSSFRTYYFDFLLLQCLSTAVYAGIDIAEKAYQSNSSLFDQAVLANDKEHVLELLSSLNCERSLKQRLKFLEKKLVKEVRGIKVERLPKHYVLTEFYMGFIQKEKNLLGVEHILSKF